MDRIGVTLEPARAFLLQVVAFLPRLLGAVLILVVGWLLAKAARFAVEKALRAINFHVLTERAGLDNFLRLGGARSDTTALVAWAVYWLIILASLMVAFNSLGFSYLADLLARIVWFVPRVFLAVVVLAFGSYFARFVGDTTTGYLRSAKVQDASLLGKVAQYAVMLFVILVALDQIDIGGNIVLYTFLLILGGIVLALALAFGLGGREWAAQRLEQWWPSPGARGQAADPAARRRPPPDLP
ncbi:mechanosensitive ion channel family protein [Ramlibacter rhizophilus]|uniref:Small-conductance mechanosensitive channel n=1 Tax=Ramlibacter rhizophilus TaxID=1781167 RepID=A0A4Z0BS82_9BURK|nr:hypothetical protein [Ramlibacter rhizophilus]TFZ01701.1 hypothetical protein EZ242_08785 [Ramlibacter rhizophilus]